MNLVDAILKERDRLAQLRARVGKDFDTPAFIFWRAFWQDLMDRADSAIGGRLDVVQMLVLYEEMKKFKG